MRRCTSPPARQANCCRCTFACRRPSASAPAGRWAVADIRIRLMTVDDVDAVHAIEAVSFTPPWSREAFVKETTENRCARYLVIEEDGAPIGYAGVWLVLDEGHITNIAIAPDRRGKGYGERLLRALIQLAADTGLSFLTLECRRSNAAAQALYHKLGFVDVGYRKRYYPDNAEDALVLTLTQLPPGNPDGDPFLCRE
ncbi:MAG: ribosomal protein S18-alanine N-acetyltransferase [Clostridiales bacterium]|nr:ribosomal protein S18-alanine N-acetyltransferase [Clostridiales bacterium]